MTTLGPLLFIAARGSVAAAVLLPLAFFEYRRAHRLSSGKVDALPAGLWRAAAVAGLAFVTAAALQQFGLKTATATNGGFLTALYVVLTPPLAFMLRGTRPSTVIVPAIGLSAVGTWMLGGGSVAALSGGDWLIAACAIGWALHVILSESGSAFDRPILFTGLQFAVVAGVSMVGAVLFEPISIAALKATAGEILYGGRVVECADVHDPDTGFAACARVGGRSHREYGKPICGFGRRAAAGGKSDAAGVVPAPR